MFSWYQQGCSSYLHENTLAAHAYWEHNVTTKEGFDDLNSIYIIKNKDPAQLPIQNSFYKLFLYCETLWLECFKPYWP